MNTIKSDCSNSTITSDYCEETNTLEICIGNKDGFRFVHLSLQKTEHLIDIINEFKTFIV